MFLYASEVSEFQKSMELNREHLRAIIYFNFMLKRTQQETHELLQQAFGSNAPHVSTVYYWFTEFKRHRCSLSDDERPGRPHTAVTEETNAAGRKEISK